MTKDEDVAEETMHWRELEHLHFDPENPRLPDEINGKDESEVLEWMLRQGDSIELIASIGATGYSIAEPLLVIEIPAKNGDYLVVEGNRRLAALKLLNNPELAPIKQKSVAEVVATAKHKPTSIPVIIYKSREDAFAYLGYRHIAGIRPWGPLQKARYVSQLYAYYTKQGLNPEDAVRTIATVAASKPYSVKKSLMTLAIYDLAKEKGYWDIKNISSENIDFSVLGTAFNYSGIVKYINLTNATDYQLTDLSEDKLSDIFNWLFSKVIGDKARITESRQLKTLAKVVAIPSALAAFKSGVPLQDAALLTDEADESFQTIAWKIQSYTQQLESLISVVEPSEGNLELLRTISSKIKILGTTLKERKDKKEDDF